jgi:hypothetical protein
MFGLPELERFATPSYDITSIAKAVVCPLVLTDSWLAFCFEHGAHASSQEVEHARTTMRIRTVAASFSVIPVRALISVEFIE